MRIFITGAEGFVGKHLVRRLAESGHEAVGSVPGVDVTDEDALRTTLAREKPDAIIHLAAISSIPASLDDASLTYRVNFLGARFLLEAALRETPRARILLIGSGHQYGTTSSAAGKPFREDTPFAPGSPYATTKAAADLLGECYAQRGLDVLRVRPFNHTGPGQNDSLVVSSFARQLTEIEAGIRKPLIEIGNLDSVRDFLHVDDVIAAYLALLDPKVPAGAYNVASGEATRIGDLFEAMVEATTGAKTKAMSETKGAAVTRTPSQDLEIRIDPRRFRPTDYAVGDASLLKSVTGWSPKISLEETTRELLDSWRAQVRSANA